MWLKKEQVPSEGTCEERSLGYMGEAHIEWGIYSYFH